MALAVALLAAAMAAVVYLGLFGRLERPADRMELLSATWEPGAVAVVQVRARRSDNRPINGNVAFWPHKGDLRLMTTRHQRNPDGRSVVATCRMTFQTPPTVSAPVTVDFDGPRPTPLAASWARLWQRLTGRTPSPPIRQRLGVVTLPPAPSGT